MRRGEPTYVATLRESPNDADQGPTPESILQVFEEFQDVMPKELPKSLPAGDSSQAWYISQSQVEVLHPGFQSSRI